MSPVTIIAAVFIRIIGPLWWKSMCDWWFCLTKGQWWWYILYFIIIVLMTEASLHPQIVKNNGYLISSYFSIDRMAYTYLDNTYNDNNTHFSDKWNWCHVMGLVLCCCSSIYCHSVSWVVGSVSWNNLLLTNLVQQLLLGTNGLLRGGLFTPGIAT